EMMNLIFMTLLFASSMPMLLPITAAMLGVSYWVDKCELLRLSKEPPTYSGHMAKMALNLLGLASTLHLLLAIWAFTLWETEADASYKPFLETPVTLFCDLWKSLPSPLDDLFGLFDTETAPDRVLRQPGAPLVAALVSICGGKLFMVAAESGKHLLEKLRGKEDGTNVEGLPPLDVALRTGALLGPKTYDVCANPKYAEAYVVVAWDSSSTQVVAVRGKAKEEDSSNRDMQDRVKGFGLNFGSFFGLGSKTKPPTDAIPPAA
ncbi:hypothetical protein CYMTET_31098, partial [Cymbomonas tetramitiformis]